MTGRDVSIARAILAEAESAPGVRAGIVPLAEVLRGPSYQVHLEGFGTTDLSDESSVVEWPPQARTVLVLGLHHPDNELPLDWWDRGNSPGNRRLVEISESLKHRLLKAYGMVGRSLPYHVERGGVFLKDAAVLAGLGVVGRNNLLLHPEWGPRIRLRAVLIEADLAPSGSLQGFSPCESCLEPCHKACPGKAFPGGVYARMDCMARIRTDVENKTPGGEVDESGHPVSVIQYCRACELSCPLGR